MTVLSSLKKVVIVLIFFSSLPLFADVTAESEDEPIPTPIYVFNPKLQADFFPTPFPKKLIYWKKDSATKVLIDKEKGYSLFLSGKIANTKIYLADSAIKTEEGNFQLTIPLEKTSSYVTLTIERSNGERIAYHLHYFWLNPPTAETTIVIKEKDKTLKKSLAVTGEYPARERLAFSWERTESPVPPLGLAKRVYLASNFKAFTFSGLYNLQDGGGRLTTSKLAYSPYFDLRTLGGRLEVGLTPLKNKDQSLFTALNFSALARYRFYENYALEAGGGLAVLFAANGGVYAMTNAAIERKINWLSFLDSVALSYSTILMDPFIHQLSLRVGLLF